MVKIVLLVAFIMVSTNAITGILYYRYAYETILQNTAESSRDICYQINVYLTGRIRSLTSRIYAISNNVALYSSLDFFLQEPSSASRIKLQGLMGDTINEIKFGDRYIDSMIVCTEYGDFDNFTQPRRQDFSFKDSPFYRYFERNPGELIAWFPAMANPVYKNSETVLPVVFLLYLSRRPVYFAVFLRQSEIETYLADAYPSLERVFIIDREGGNILNFSAGDEEVLSFFSPEDLLSVNAVSREISRQGRPYLASFTRMPMSLWSIYTLRSRNSLIENITTLRRYILLVLCLSIISGVLLALFFSRSISREEEQQKRISELKALQAQINPHFLYNTLNTISWLAADQEAEEIAMMSNSLGKFFRICLSRGREFISVGEELDHVLSYLSIQSIRYKSKLEYTVDVPEDMRAYGIIKLVLQPLVENAIYHGIKPKEGKGHIIISAVRRGEGNGRYLEFCVSDDGVGIEAGKLKNIRNTLRCGGSINADRNEDSGYGIFNVNERIRLYYGEAWGLDMQSPPPRTEAGDSSAVPLRGTAAILSLPLLYLEEK
jgi:two-component system sensor histidine kinase YesM